jgi:hypothetical protein
MVNKAECPSYARTALERIKELAARRAVRITQKAMWEMAVLDPPAHIDDVVETLERLEPGDWAGRLTSQITGEAMYVFKPMTLFGLLYVKVVLRNDCVVVSFHEEVET